MNIPDNVLNAFKEMKAAVQHGVHWDGSYETVSGVTKEEALDSANSFITIFEDWLNNNKATVVVNTLPCQIADVRAREKLTCTAREGGGLQCERLDPHPESGEHWISKHTCAHSMLGNGYSCDAV